MEDTNLQRVDVVSSNIKSIGYDENDRILEIVFKGDRIYQYIGVPLDVYTSLMNAQSHGKYFSSDIRDKYLTRRVK